MPFEFLPEALALLLDDERGATAIEYGLIVALIAIATIAALQSAGNELATTFSTVSTTLGSHNTL